MTSLKKLIAVVAVSLPLVAMAQPAPEPAPAAPPAAAPAEPAAKPAPAPAKPPLAQIYGTLNVNFQVEEAYGATNPAQSIRYRFGLSTDSTNIGVRGTADLGTYGLGVVYQCESSALLDGVGPLGLCGRNSRLGLSSPYGTLFYGNWDTPYKAAWFGTKADDAFSNTDVYDSESIMGSPGFNTKTSAGVTAAATGTLPSLTGVAASTTTAFAVRAADSVAYHSPKYMGASFKAQYSANRFADSNVVRSPELYSAVVNYDFGPFSVLGAYEDHEDWQTSRSRDSGWKVGAGYELGSPFGTTTIGAVYEELKYRAFGATTAATSLIGTAGLKEYKRPAVMVNLKHRMGNHEFRARWENAEAGDCKLTSGATCVTAGLGAKDYALGYAYYLSKAAQVYAFWTQIDNERNASYTFATAGFAAIAAATPPGADPWSAGLGMRYAF